MQLKVTGIINFSPLATSEKEVQADLDKFVEQKLNEFVNSQGYNMGTSTLKVEEIKEQKSKGILS